MSNQLEPSLKIQLRRLIVNSGKNLSLITLLSDLSNNKDRNINRQLLKTLNDVFEKDALAYQLFKEEFQSNLRTKSPLECVRKLLKSYIEKSEVKFGALQSIDQLQNKKIKQNSGPIAEEEIETSVIQQQDQQQENIPKMRPVSLNIRSASPTHEFQPRATTSMSTPITPFDVPDIVKKVSKAASDGLSKSAKNSSITIATLGAAETVDIAVPNILPSPAQQRPHGLKYFNQATSQALATIPIEITNCAGLSIVEQEREIIDDLLYCFIGIPGTYIKPIVSNEADNRFGPIKFKISEQIDISLREIVKDILPIASHYSIIQKFVQWGRFMNNQIIQALSAALQDILDKYAESVIQLETEQMMHGLNLHKLIFFMRPNMQTLDVLARIIIKIGINKNLIGGKILTLLHDEVTLLMGDARSQELLIELTEQAAIPYIEMLQLWILKGVICDPHKQFFVVDHGDYRDENANNVEGEMADTARYWECRYTIQRERVPKFLENDADVILRTGKYLNVIRQCGHHRIAPLPELIKLEFIATNNNHKTFIKYAYHHASNTLLDMLIKQHNLMGHITSVKRYFLLQQGDLITQFMEATEEELSKNVDKVTPVRLDNLLQLIVRTSSAKNDPCLDNLQCDLFTMDLATQMSKIAFAGAVGNLNEISITPEDNNESATKENIDLNGLECFTFQYNIHWPVSIVLNQSALSQYQMLFRLLFYCKHVERQLGKVWLENSHIRKHSPKSTDKWRSAYALRQRMLNAIQHLENYMMIEVIEPNWHQFTEKMKTVQNIDDVIVIHQDFLHMCLQNCMLNYPDLLRNVINMCNCCLKFCKFIQTESTVEKITEKWLKCIDDMSIEFTQHLIDLMKRINNDLSAECAAGAKLINLICRINFNSFYSDMLDQIEIKTKANDTKDSEMNLAKAKVNVK